MIVIRIFFTAKRQFCIAMIEIEKLVAHGGITISYKKNQTIFFEGNKPLFYYQVLDGSIKMVNTNDKGKEFIQGIFTKNQSFGEPVLFIDQPYPAGAVANENSVVIKIRKQSFLNIVDEFPEILLSFTQVFAKRIYNKSIIAKEMALHNPEHRIFTVLNLFKKNTPGIKKKRFKIDMSRQQIADMTGLRVETVIRTIKALQKKNRIKIERGKIFLED